MLKLEDIKKDAQLHGIESDEIVRIVAVDRVGEHAVTAYYKRRGICCACNNGAYCI